MSFFISDAQAAAGGASQGDIFTGFVLPLLFLIAAFWFILVRPQQKRQKEHNALLANLGKGDEVVTTGGVHGRVKDVGEGAVTLEIAKGVEVKLQKNAITQVLPKGTLKHL
ncbi:MAG: preprotein translocase subunit YajC [Bacillota bacterium]